MQTYYRRNYLTIACLQFSQLPVPLSPGFSLKGIVNAFYMDTSDSVLFRNIRKVRTEIWDPVLISGSTPDLIPKTHLRGGTWGQDSGPWRLDPRPKTIINCMTRDQDSEIPTWYPRPATPVMRYLIPKTVTRIQKMNQQHRFQKDLLSDFTSRFQFYDLRKTCLNGSSNLKTEGHRQ